MRARAPIVLVQRAATRRAAHRGVSTAASTVQYANNTHEESPAWTLKLLALGSALVVGMATQQQSSNSNGVRQAHCESLDAFRTSGACAGSARKAGDPQTEQDKQQDNNEEDDLSASEALYFDAEYETKNLIGAGTFGMVMQCVSKKDGHVAAVKMMQDLVDTREEIEREKEALAFIQQLGGHEHIIRYGGSYTHNGFHYIVTEYVPGESLYSFLQKRRQVDVSTALQFIAQLADALLFMQQSGIVHRDLKPENIMVVDEKMPEDAHDDTPKLKIIDFGSAGTSASSASSKSSHTISLSGTRCYWSPEVLQRQEMTPAMDMWSLGCVLYILISGRHPFDIMGSSSEEQIVHRIATESVSFLHPVWTNVSCEVKELIRGLLEKDPRARFSVDDVLAHLSMVLHPSKKELQE
ncbi:Camk protein kinase, partial [Globisporangium splendens]